MKVAFAYTTVYNNFTLGSVTKREFGGAKTVVPLSDGNTVLYVTFTYVHCTLRVRHMAIHRFKPQFDDIKADRMRSHGQSC